MNKLRTAIAGFGFMGKTHASTILHSETMTLAAIIDPKLNLAQKGGNLETGELDIDDLSGVNTYTNMDECLEKETLDLIFICVHTYLHYEIAMKSLKKGLHVFIEKPFVLNIDDGIALINEAKRQNRKIGVAHVVRFFPAYRKLLELYKNQTYGELRFLSLTRFTGVPDWGEWTELRKNFGASGGALFDLVIHDIDFLQYMLGLPDEVDARHFAGELSEYDYVCAFWIYKQRAFRVKVEGGNPFPSQFPFEAGFKAAFEKATVLYSSSQGNELKIIDNDAVQTLPLDDINEGYKCEAEYFAQCIINNVYPEACSAESSLATILLCHKHGKSLYTCNT